MIPTYEFLTRLCERSAAAVVGQSGLRNVTLNRHLRSALSAAPGEPGSFLADPVLEGAFGFSQADKTMAELGGLLHPSLLDALDNPRPDPQRGGGPYRFAKHWLPYTHQHQAWTTLLDAAPSSVLVSSGTGSGKTECFLIPILQDMLSEAHTAGRLSGVRALMLYPLNALINSQRDRLFDWTSSFQSLIRFCLYNGSTPSEQVKAATARARPNEVLDRPTLRADPPPILVTNITMLEYMLIRQVDAPILEASRGKLRWIVLDEAHSYIGSQAAELALLLRRVMRGFGVSPGEVRFVATSATLGKGEGVDTKLRDFLSDLSGMPSSRVHVINGVRDVPALEALINSTDDKSDEATSFEAMFANAAARKLRSELTDRPGLTLAQAARAAFGQPEKRSETMRLAEAASRAKRRGTRFLPLRLHLTHRAQAGFWACADAQCGGRLPGAEDHASWPWGAVSVLERERCASCQGPMFEIVACGSCGGPHLLAEEARDGRISGRIARIRSDDEFSQGAIDPVEMSDDDDADATPAEPGRKLVIGGGAEATVRVAFDPVTGVRTDVASGGLVTFRTTPDGSCSHCGEAEGFRRARFGAPFLLGAATPQLLDRVDPKSDLVTQAGETPVRQLITFTDSRQGTARFSARLQQDSERGLVRAALYHAVQSSGPKGADKAALDAKTQMLARLEASGAVGVESMIVELRKEVSALEARGGRGLSFDDAVEALTAEADLERLRVEAWEHRDQRFSDGRRLARILVAREVFRRPRRANTAETMGLVGLRFHAIEQLKDTDAPRQFRSRGFSIEHWRNFLYAAELTVFRLRGAVHVTPDEMRWMGLKGYAREVRKERPEHRHQSVAIWPDAKSPYVGRSHLIKLLSLGLNLDLTRPEHQDDAQECLDLAWNHILRITRSTNSGGYQIDLSKANFARVETGFLCPVTQQILDTSFCGLTPWQPKGVKKLADKCLPIAMPRLPFTYPRAHEELERMAVWLEADPCVERLREIGVWGDLHDRVALFPPAILTAEHSAQQPSWRLQFYEKRFKQGRINILNCSTTMEMGVDIGGLQAVVNTNVPPSAASYRQRVGRAGRRGEAMALALTFARDEPFGWTSYENPLRPLEAAIRAPSVSLDSAVIAQRHANALLMSAYLATESGEELHKLTAGVFFARTPDGTKAEQDPSSRFLKFCKSPNGLPADLARDLKRLLAGTRLADVARVEEETGRSLERARQTWLSEWEALARDVNSVTEAPAKARLGAQLRRLCGAYLLGELSQRGFLPAYGFPTDVVPFLVPQESSESRRRENASAEYENAFLRLDAPTRSLDQAIRDYAPGAEVVLDGLVYRSAGVTLNWKRPANSDERAPQSIRWGWRCLACDACGDAPGRPVLCSVCASDDLARVEYLRPSGFVFDENGDRPHTDISAVDFVEPTPPFVAADGADWTALPNPEAGRMRAAREGSILFRAEGAEGQGYALCLHCGRAEADVAPILGAAAPLPRSLSAHKPLRARAGQMLCEGTMSDFGVKRNLRLGHSARTDVFELQLEALVPKDREKHAVSLAIALREALSRELGIEASELGYKAERRRFSDQRVGWSILLFDQASGGAGFASQAVELVTSLLRSADGVLDCDAPGCRTACASCLLSNDSRFDADRLDRAAALSLLQNEVLKLLVLPLRLRIFGERTRAEARPPADAIAAALSGPAPVTLYFSGPPSTFEPAAWPGLRLVTHATDKGAAVRFVIPADTLAGLTLAQRLGLRALLLRDGTTLHETRESPSVGGTQLIAAVGAGPNSMLFAVTEPTATHLSGSWGSLGPTVLLAGPGAAPDLGAARDPALLEPTVGANARRIILGRELDGDLKGFGRRFWTLIEKAVPEIAAARREGDPVTVAYDDRYMKAPLQALLLGSVLTSWPGGLGSSLIKVRSLDDEDRSKHPSAIDHDWPAAQLRGVVLKAYFAGLGLDCAVVLASRSIVPHDRSLTLTWASGTTAVINLDKGFGAWRTSGTAPFDFTRSGASQAQALVDVGTVTVRGESTLFYVTCS